MSNRVYEGRFKGNSETHCPNDTFREAMDNMNLPSYEPITCPECGLVTRVHRLEQKIWSCPCSKN